jgi:hypothetical protein
MCSRFDAEVGVRTALERVDLPRDGSISRRLYPRPRLCVAERLEPSARPRRRLAGPVSSRRGSASRPLAEQDGTPVAVDVDPVGSVTRTPSAACLTLPCCRCAARRSRPEIGDVQEDESWQISQAAQVQAYAALLAALGPETTAPDRRRAASHRTARGTTNRLRSRPDAALSAVSFGAHVRADLAL